MSRKNFDLDTGTIQFHDLSMDSLPIDILIQISRHLSRKDLVHLMLVARRYHLVVREALYSHLHINLFSLQFKKTSALDSPRSGGLLRSLCSMSPASSVRHLTITGIAFANVAQQQELREALSRTIYLLSLDIAIKTFPDSVAREIFNGELCGCPTFLPELVALRTDDVEVAMALVPRRPVHTVYVNDTIGPARFPQFLDALATSHCDIMQLQVRLEVSNNTRAASAFNIIASTFKKVSMLGVELDIISPSEKPLSWTSTKAILQEVGPALGCLYSLHSLSICIYPEPLAQEQGLEEAMSVCRRYCSTLRRLELKWHVWTPQGGCKPVTCRDELLRGQWKFRKQGTH